MDTSLRVLIFWLMACIVNASDLCIMLSSTEEAALIRAQEQAKMGERGQGANPINLRLDGIIYTDQNSWTIWLNGRTIKPGQKIDALRIVKVTPESVELMWYPKRGEHHQISLRLNEAYQSSHVIPELGDSTK